MSIKMIPFINKETLNKAKKLKKEGPIQKGEKGLLYIDVDDAYIYDLYPSLGLSNFSIPDYFSKNKKGGAHISLAYPDEYNWEQYLIQSECIKFEVKALSKFTLSDKEYITLIVDGPRLVDIRRSIYLSDFPQYRGEFVPFHITIARRLIV